MCKQLLYTLPYPCCFDLRVVAFILQFHFVSLPIWTQLVIDAECWQTLCTAKMLALHLVFELEQGVWQYNIFLTSA